MGRKEIPSCGFATSSLPWPRSPCRPPWSSLRWRRPITSITPLTRATSPRSTRRATRSTTRTTRTRQRRPPERRPVAWHASAGDVDDAQLVAGALAGRRDCFETLVERHQRTVYTLVYRWLNDHAVADEVVQATFVQAYTHLVDFRGEASFRSWLYGIALNQTRSLLRSRRRQRTVSLDEVPERELPPTDAAFHDASQDAERRDELGRLIEHLPPRQRAVVTLRIVGDLPFKEIARL